MTKKKKESNLTTLKIISLLLLIIAPIYGIINFIIRIFLKISFIKTTYIFLIFSVISLILTIIVFIKKKSNILNIVNLTIAIFYLTTSIILLPIILYYDMNNKKLTEIPQLEVIESECFIYTKTGILLEHTCDNNQIVIPAKIDKTEIIEIDPNFFNQGTIKEIYLLSKKEYRIPEYAFANEYQEQEINIYYRGTINWTTKEDDLCKTYNNYFTCENEYTDSEITIKSKHITDITNKHVSLKPTIKFNPPTNQSIETITLDKDSIIISGYTEIIEDIDSIDVDITMNGDTYKATPKLPFLTTTDTIIDVLVKTNISQKMDIKIETILTKNLDNKYWAVLESKLDDIVITIEGTESNLQNYSLHNLEIYVDLNGYKEGTHEVEVKVNTNSEYIRATCTNRIIVKIEKR